MSKGDGGAKGKGQVMIVGHSDDMQKSVSTHTNNNNKLVTPIPIVCKIDLSRLARIPSDRNSRSNNNNSISHNSDVEFMVNFNITYIFAYLLGNNHFLQFPDKQKKYTE